MLKKITVAAVIAVTLFAGSAFASWSGSGTGSCTYGAITFYPWQNWGPPTYENGFLTGDWNDNYGQEGTFSAVRDSVVTGGLFLRKSYYHGTVFVTVSDTLSVAIGPFTMVSTLYESYCLYSGLWSDNNGYCDCTGGTITGEMVYD